MDHTSVERLWTHLHWLTVLAEQGSFTAAAERLQVSKAAMSQRMAELEKAAGVPLVRRTTRSMVLTDAGARLVAQTRSSYEAIARSFTDTRDSAGEPAGAIRLTAPVALARQRLVPVLTEFLQRYPDIHIELVMSDRLASLGAEGFDLAVRHCASAPDTHVAWQLCTTESVLVASRDYLERRGQPQEPTALRDHACLHYPRGRDEVVWSLERGTAGSREHERISVAVSGPLAANNSEALRDAAGAGLGIALIPDFSAEAMLRCGQLLRVLPAWRASGTFADRIFALRPYAPRVPRAVEVLVAFLREQLQGGFAMAEQGGAG
jgi:DNA-binding transcriptional LysR family regulator